MIQLRKDDFLWRCYDRYYQGENTFERADDANGVSQPPHPHSICNFFWKAVGGLIKSWCWDSNPLIAFPILVLVCSVLIYGISAVILHGKTGMVGIMYVLSSMVFCLLSFLFVVIRWVGYWEKQGRKGRIVNSISVTAFVVLLFSTWFSTFFITKEAPWEPIYLLYGFSAVSAICMSFLWLIGICYLLFSKKSPTGQVITSYLGSFKDKVCPMVKAPWEEEKHD